MSNTPLDSFGKFSSQAKTVLLAAQRYAEAMHSQLGSEHLFMAVTVTPDTASYQLLRKIPITADQLRLALTVNGPQTNKQKTAQQSGMRPEAKSVLERAAFQATVLGTSQIETEFILWSLVSDSNCVAYKLVQHLGVEPKSIRKSLERLFLEEYRYSAIPHDIEILGVIGTPEHNHGHDTARPDPSSVPDHVHLDDADESESDTPVLDEFTIDLTALAGNDECDPLIGRDDELERVSHILGRKTKNNPILLGDPGVGKTAIVEGLAKRIVNRQVPLYLQGVRVLSLELGSLIAGTMYRGQFEERLKRLVSELLGQEDTVLFIDEIHTLVGAGSAEGSLDAANILKPVLAKGALRVIGATTTNEYRKYIEKDSALERRLQPIQVPEPSTQETTEILRGLAPRYANFHGVKVSDDLLEEIVTLADQYLYERHFPDKAIDILDEAAAGRKAKRGKTKQKRPSRFELERKLKELRSQKEYELKKGNFERASYLRNQEATLKLQYQRLRKKQSSRATKLVSLTSDDIRAVISRWTGIPAGQLTATDRRSLLKLKDRLATHVIGQDKPLESIAAAIRRAKTGAVLGSRPMGTFLLVGPTGVGKTETARALATEVFGDQTALLKIDMSEYMERHQVARLVGAPPGYVGHDDTATILERVRQRPHQVVLFDEIEKAHPDVFNILLQILEDGVLTDGKGRTVSFAHTIVLLTSNIGGTLWQNQGELGFSPTSRETPWWEAPLGDQLKQTFRPEFLARLDGVLTYHPLSTTHLSQILDKELAELINRFATQHKSVSVDPAAKEWLLAAVEKDSEGARAIRKLVGQQVATALADAGLRWPNATHFLVTQQRNKIKVKRSTQSVTQLNETHNASYAT